MYKQDPINGRIVLFFLNQDHTLITPTMEYGNPLNPSINTNQINCTSWKMVNMSKQHKIKLKPFSLRRLSRSLLLMRVLFEPQASWGVLDRQGVNPRATHPLHICGLFAYNPHIY